MQFVFRNDGAAFADTIEVADGLTVAQLFTQRLPYGKPQNYLLRVNRQLTMSDDVLQARDRVSITPTKNGKGDCSTIPSVYAPITTWPTMEFLGSTTTAE